MPIAIGIIAVLLIITGIKGNFTTLGTQFDQTFFGTAASTSGTGSTAVTTPAQPGFLQWAGALMGIAVIFRLIGLPQAGKMFISLVLLVYFFQHTGIISQLTAGLQAIGSGQGTTSSTAASPSSSGATSSSSASGAASVPGLSSLTSGISI